MTPKTVPKVCMVCGGETCPAIEEDRRILIKVLGELTVIRKGMTAERLNRMVEKHEERNA